ncbi:hypothetical protein LOD99_15780 [Oopsacas minuta]|uniref:Uncharacterized protein n=1 Tax=Oopsacas minuta TaxID=111878 RepID=A0AAV7K9Y6_9METZ|nr:hypothetical protein LOD99_15780 [Oopsacas minuta]
MAQISRQTSITVASPTQNSGTTHVSIAIPPESGTTPDGKQVIKEKGLYEKVNDKVDWVFYPVDKSMEKMRTALNISRFFTKALALKRFRTKKGKIRVRVGFYKSTDNQDRVEELPEEEQREMSNTRAGLELFTACLEFSIPLIELLQSI